MVGADIGRCVSFFEGRTGKEEKEAVGFDEKMAKAVQGLNAIDGLDPEVASRLVSLGFASPEVFEGVEADDLVEAGFTAEEATDVILKVQAYFSKNG